MDSDWWHFLEWARLRIGRIGWIGRRAGWVLVICLWPAIARGDGKAFARPGFARAEIPSQRALVHWSDGVETLVIETQVQAGGEELAWVIPLPAPPTEVRPVSNGLFPTLQTVFQARWVRDRSELWVGLLLGAAGLWLWRWLVLMRVPFLVAGFLVAGLGFAGLMVMSPAVSKAGAKGAAGAGTPAVPPTSGVEIRQRHLAGLFEVTVLSARTADDLLAWLKDNGFDAPAEIGPVVDQHLRAGWVLAAAKARRPEAAPGADLLTLHPLRFTFPASRPVYPLRLTGVGAEPVTVDLYVFGPARARVPGFRITYCARPDYEEHPGPYHGPDGLRIRHPEVRDLVQGAAVATKLTARLDAEQMGDDGWVQWTAFRPTGQRVYSPEAARDRAAGLTAALLCLGAMVGLARAVWRRDPGSKSAGWRGWWTTLTAPVPIVGPGAKGWSWSQGVWVLVSVGTGGMWYLATPRVKVNQETVLVRPYAWKSQGYALTALLHEWQGRWAVTNGMASSNRLEALRQAIARELVEGEYHHDYTNRFTGQLIREEVSPGNYTIRLAPDGWKFVWYDFDGAPVPER